MKSEPTVWSWDDQVKAKTTNWDGVRNPEATINLKSMRKRDRVFFYHSNEGKEIVGVAEVVKEFYPDPKDATGKYGMVDLKAVEKLPRAVTLAEIKADPKLKTLRLVTHSRLWVSPVSDEHWKHIAKLAGTQRSGGGGMRRALAIILAALALLAPDGLRAADTPSGNALTGGDQALDQAFDHLVGAMKEMKEFVERHPFYKDPNNRPSGMAFITSMLIRTLEEDVVLDPDFPYFRILDFPIREGGDNPDQRYLSPASAAARPIASGASSESSGGSISRSMPAIRT